MSTLATRQVSVVRGAARLVDGLSLSLGPSGSVALVGPNGAGKSTFLRSLAGLEQPSSGSVELDGRALAAMSLSERTRRIGYLPQHFEPHWDLTARQLVEIGAERAPVGAEAVRAVMVKYELADVAERRWSTLSGGERARVLLSMVLVSDPPVLLADEPAASLDVRHRLEVAATLADRGRTALSLVVVHDLDLAFRFFDRVIVLDKGRVVADGLAADLIHDKTLDAAFGVRFERIATAAGWSLVARQELL